MFGALLQRIRELEAEANAAIQEHERAISRLYLRIKVDGGIRKLPKADPEATREVEAELRSRRSTALRAIEQEAQALWRQAQKEAELAEQFSPDRVLSSSEREAVGRRMTIVEADIGTLRGERLTDRMRGVLEGGSAEEKFAYWMAGRKRAQQMRERQIDAVRSRADNADVAIPQEATITALDPILSELEEALVGEERRGRIEKAREVLDAADEVVRTCYLTRHEASDAYGAEVKMKYHRPANPITDPEEVPTAHGGGTIAR
jgi:hypothetical protein